MQESSSAGSVSAAGPDQSEQPDIEEMWQLWKSNQQELIVQEKRQQVLFELIIENRLIMMVYEVFRQQLLMPPPSYYQQQMLPPFPPHYDQLLIPRMQESSAVSISAAVRVRVNFNSLILKTCVNFGRVNMIS
jgi:hypothetical protein